jgi:hypothetical protein
VETYKLNFKVGIDKTDVTAFIRDMNRAAAEASSSIAKAASGAQAKVGAGAPGAVATRGIADIEGQLRGRVGLAERSGLFSTGQIRDLQGAVNEIVRLARSGVRKDVTAAGRNLTSDLGASGGKAYRSRVGGVEQSVYRRAEAEAQAAEAATQAAAEEGRLNAWRKNARARLQGSISTENAARAESAKAAELEAAARLKEANEAEKQAAAAKARADKARPIYGPPKPPKSGVAPGVAAAERQAKELAAAQAKLDREQARAQAKAAAAASEPEDAVLKRFGLLPEGGLDYYSKVMGGPGPGLGWARLNAGPTSALDRYRDLNTGIGRNEFANNTVLDGDDKTLAEMSAEARANLTSLERMRQATEELAKAEQYLADLMGLSSRDMSGKLRAAAGPGRLAELLELRAKREGTAGLQDLEGFEAAADQRRANEVKEAKNRYITDDDLDAAVGVKVESERHTNVIRGRAADEKRSNQRLIEADAERIVATNLASSASKRMAADMMRAAGVGREREATPTQRFQAWIANRGGGDNLPRPATDFMQGKQLAASRIMTTASFAASGGLLYGAMSLGSDIMRESTELQVELGIIESQINSLDATANKVSLEKLRDELHKTSVASGVEMNEVANVTRQLAGAFADPETGNANFALAQKEADVALRYSKISGIPQQEITDSMSAISLAFRDVDTDVPLGFERILDTVLALENRFGVLSPEIVKFTADLAPLGKELGFTQEQLSGLGAVAQSRSGRSGTVLSEQLGRILPSLQDQQKKLYELFSLNANTEGAVGDLMKGFSEGDTPEVLRTLVKNYDKLTKEQQNEMASLVGSRREAATFYALLDSPKLTEDVLNGDFVAGGEFENRWDSYEQTVTLSTQRMRRAVEEFGQKLFDAGIDDLLIKGAQFGTVIAAALSGAVSWMTKLNDLMGGHLTTVLLAVGAWRTFGPYVAKAVAAMKGSAAFGGLMGRSGAVPGAAGPMVGAGPFGGMLYAAPPVQGPPAPGTPGAPRQPLRSRIGGSAVLGQLSTAVAGYAVLELGAEIDEVKKQIDVARTDLRSKIAEALDSGVTEEELRRRIDSAPQYDSGLFTEWSGISGISSGIPLPNVKNIIGKIFGVNTDAKAPGLEELEGELTARAAERQVAEGQALIDAFNEAFSSSGENGLIASWENLGFKIDRDKDRLPPEVKAALALPGMDKVGIDSGFSMDNLVQLLLLRQQNPDQKIYQQLLDFIINQASMDPELLKLINAATSAFDDKTAKDAASAELETEVSEARTAFETAMGSLEAANEAGRVSVKPLMDRIAEERAFYVEMINRARDAGNEDLVKEYEQMIYELDSKATDIFTSDTDTGSDIRSRLLELSGVGNSDPGGTRVEQAQGAYDRIAEAQGILVSAKAEKAMEVLEAQQEDLDQQIADATDPAERDRLLAEKIQVSDAMRTDLVRSQLQSDRPAEIRDMVVDALQIKVEEAEALIAQAIIATDEINESILMAGLEAQRRQLQAAIKALGPAGIMPWNKKGSKLRARLEEVLAAIEALGELDNPNVISDLSELGAKGGGKNGKDTASDANANAEAYGALLSAQLARDPVAQARQNLANANAAVGRADTEAARLQALAGQVSAQHALEDAMQAMWEAQIDVANAMSESVGDVVAVANRNAAVAQERLRIAQSNGTGGAEIYALQAAAIRAQTEAVETARGDRVGDLEYLYEFDKITAEQFIKSLQAELLLIPEANKNARREIERRIKALRDEMSSNMSMNIPSEITLPTLYEARRLNSNRGSGGPAWGTYSQLQSIDNRIVTINVFESGDTRRTTRAVSEAMDASPRSGSFATGEWV